MGLHRTQGHENNHVVHSLSYADAAARTGATGLTSSDVGRVARQEDDDTFWILQDVTPTWGQIDGAGAGLVDADYGDIVVSGSGSTMTIDAESVTFTKMINASGEEVLIGRGEGGGAGDFQEITLGTNLSMTGTVLNATGGGSITTLGVLALPPLSWTPRDSDDWDDTAGLAAGQIEYDPDNAVLPVLAFDDTVEELFGGKEKFIVPIGTTHVRVHLRSRADVVPGGAVAAVIHVCFREWADNTGPTAWNAKVTILTPIALPTNNDYQADSETFTVGTLGLTAGRAYQIMIFRDPFDASDTLVGDLLISLFDLEFRTTA